MISCNTLQRKMVGNYWNVLNVVSNSALINYTVILFVSNALGRYGRGQMNIWKIRERDRGIEGMPRKQTIKSLRKKATYEWGLSVRERDNHLCQWCLYDGKQVKGNQPHHIISKAQGNIARFTLANGVTLCWRCHHVRLLQQPIEFTEFISQWLAKHMVDYHDMKERFNEDHPIKTIDEYEAIIVNLRWFRGER